MGMHNIVPAFFNCFVNIIVTLPVVEQWHVQAQLYIFAIDLPQHRGGMIPDRRRHAQAIGLRGARHLAHDHAVDPDAFLVIHRVVALSPREHVHHVAAGGEAAREIRREARDSAGHARRIVLAEEADHRLAAGRVAALHGQEGRRVARAELCREHRGRAAARALDAGKRGALVLGEERLMVRPCGKPMLRAPP